MGNIELVRGASELADGTWTMGAPLASQRKTDVLFYLHIGARIQTLTVKIKGQPNTAIKVRFTRDLLNAIDRAFIRDEDVKRTIDGASLILTQSPRMFTVRSADGAAIVADLTDDAVYFGIADLFDSGYESYKDVPDHAATTNPLTIADAVPGMLVYYMRPGLDQWAVITGKTTKRIRIALIGNGPAIKDVAPQNLTPDNHITGARTLEETLRWMRGDTADEDAYWRPMRDLITAHYSK